MLIPLRFRPYMFPVAINVLLFLWAWLGVNQGKGLFYFTTDELGLLILLPVAILVNVFLLLICLLLGKNQRKGFGRILLLLAGSCITVWVHGCATGVAY